VNVPIKIRIRVNLFSLAMLLVSLVGLCLLSPLAWRWAEAQQPESLQAAAVMPSYYITDLSYYPDEAPTACAAGYHFASLWEISNPSNLRYNTALGQTTLDSGSGPPTIQGLGWVRTGYNAGNVSSVAGRANCNLWTSRSNLDNGSVAVLPQLWTAGAQDLFVWDVDVRTCNFKLGVWCKQDSPSAVYLPLILKP
jgi:hypothetical protein